MHKERNMTMKSCYNILTPDENRFVNSYRKLCSQYGRIETDEVMEELFRFLNSKDMVSVYDLVRYMSQQRHTNEAIWKRISEVEDDLIDLDYEVHNGYKTKRKG